MAAFHRSSACLLAFFVLVTTGSAVMEEVVLMEQPQSGYVVKSRPYTVSCRAVNAKTIKFKCNNKWMDDTRVEQVLGTDPSTQLPYLHSSIEITRQEVDTSVHLEDFSCQCFASGASDSQTVRSDAARVRVAYMRKHFQHQPASERVAEGSTVQLPCASPESDPKAQLSWMKDGQPIDHSDPSIILANDGSLIISAARLTDSGEYVCEASNPANKRSTDPARVEVYVNGGWSEWSEWAGGCEATDCEELRLRLRGSPADALPRLRRTRACNNPAPLNGGSYCAGQEEEFRGCPLSCRIDGGWSAWAEWGTCTPACHHFRTRSCTQPPPMNGGSGCIGREVEGANCTTGYCMQAAPPPLTNPQHEGIQLSPNAALLGGVACVAVLLAVIVALCVALLCKKSSKASTNGSSNIYYAESGGRRDLLDQKQALLEYPKLSGVHTLGSYSHAPSPLHPSFTLRSAKSAYSGYSANRHQDFPGSRAALLPECSSNSSSGKHSVEEEGEQYATLYDMHPTYDQTSTHSLDSSQSVIAAQVDERGARLQLRKCGAALLVPELALAEERMVYLAVSDQPDDRPQLPPGEVVLSPVVIVGECESSPSPPALRRPVVVSFRHCAATFPKDNWTFSLYADDGHGWRQVCRVGEETLMTPVHVHLDAGRTRGGEGWAHVMTQDMGRYLLVGRQRRASLVPLKRVRLAAFASVPQATGEFDIRVYCVPETGSAVEAVWRQEGGSRLLGQAGNFPLRPEGELCFCIEQVEQGYAVRGSQFVEIPDTHHQWCSQNGLHCSMHVACEDAALSFDGRLVVYQKGNTAERQLIRLDGGVDRLYDATADDEEDKVLSVDLQLPWAVRLTLAEEFDPPVDADRDWRGLAKRLQLDRYVQFFATRPGCSPTILLLDLWEAAHSGEARAVPDLLQTVRVLGKPRAVDILEHLLS